MKITTKNKLDYLKETKSAIKNALIEKGQVVEDTDTFRSYAEKITKIKSEAEMNEILMYQNTITGFTANGDLGGLYTANCPSELADFEIVPGQEYVVLWDDVGYSVIAQDASAVLPGTLFMGNGSALGLTGNNEPFAIGYSASGITFVSYDTTATHSVGIIKRVRHQDLLLQDIEITENGEYSPGAAYDGFGNVSVNVAGGSSADVRYVTFDNHDGTEEYGKKPVAVGDDCADPIARGIFGTPTRESTPQEDYTHNGWASEPNGAADPNWNKAITEDKTVYAAFKSSTRYYTISFYDVDELLNTEQVLHNGSSDYVPPVKDGYFFDTWEPKPVNVTSDISCYAQYKESIDFATATWAEISSVSEKGEATMHFAVGDEKTFTYTDQNGNSNTCTAVIVGFDHDDLSDGTGKAGISLMVKELLPSSTVKWWGNTYATAYKASTLRTTLRDTVINYFPEDLRNVIKEVNKLADSKTSAGTPTIESVACKLWAPSQCEFYDFNQTNYESVIGEKYEGPVYPSTILKNETGKSFYTRDIIRTGSPAPKYYKNTNGNVAISYSEAQTTLRNIVVGFCI